MDQFTPRHESGWRRRLHDVIFYHDTPVARGFDLVLIVAILLSVVVVMVESVPGVRTRYGPQLRAAEWFFTILFTLEYVMRLITTAGSLRYARSFFGIVDLLSILPTYLSLLIPGAHTFAAIRLLRILRVFRVLKLAQYISEVNLLSRALLASLRKITVFLITVVTLVNVLGALMYFIEGGRNGFTSIPESVYWAIVTLTTVGYGDIAPQTPLGKVLASVVMIMGYSIIAVPTGIVTAEISRADREMRGGGPVPAGRLRCPSCSAADHRPDALHCRLCGVRLVREPYPEGTAPAPEPPAPAG